MLFFLKTSFNKDVFTDSTISTGRDTSYFKSTNSPTQIDNLSAVVPSTYEPISFVAANESPINCSMGQQIGRGSFGTVNICTDLNTGHFYAVKHVSFDTKFMSNHLKKVRE